MKSIWSFETALSRKILISASCSIFCEIWPAFSISNKPALGKQRVMPITMIIITDAPILLMNLENPFKKA